MDSWNADDGERRLLDRLVDGELGGAERAALLHRLDQQPDGWRRCALAFLEAQSWGQDFSGMAESGAAPPEAKVAAAAVPGAAARANGQSRGWTFFAAAACMLLAFGFGLWVRGMLTATSSARTPVQIAERLTGPSQDNTDAAGVASRAASSIHLAVADGQTGQTSQIEVPIVEAANFTPAATRWEHSLPADVVDALRQSGHEVEQQQQFWPVRLQDGRTAILPVEEVQVRYVGELGI